MIAPRRLAARQNQPERQAVIVRRVQTSTIARLYDSEPRWSSEGFALLAALWPAAAMSSSVGRFPIKSAAASVAKNAVESTPPRAIRASLTLPSSARVIAIATPTVG